MATEMIRQPRNTRRKDARPGEIIDAALQEFALRGFAAARLEDMAKRAGISKGTIYLYFKNKEELFKAVVLDKIIPAIEEMKRELSGDKGSAEETLRAISLNVSRQLLNNEQAQISRLIICEGRNFPELAEFYYREVIQRVMSHIHSIVKKGVERGEFRDSGIIDYPFLLQTPVIITLMWKNVFSELDTLDTGKMINVHLDTLFQGLKKE